MECCILTYFLLFCGGYILYFLYSRSQLIQKWKKSLKGKVVLVTGSANGLGRDICFALAREQCHLVCVDCNEKANMETIEKLKQISPDSMKIHAYTIDLTDPKQIADLKEKVFQEFDTGIDILINNAGIMWPCRLLKMSDARIQRIIDTNLVAHFWLIRAFLPKMIEKNDGHIVTVASAMVNIPLESFAPYRATKCGVTALMQSLTYELKAMGNDVKTLVVFPSFLSTEMLPKNLYKLGSGLTWINGVPIEITSTKDAAQNIIKAIKDGRRTLYIPYYHYLALLVLKILPEFLQDLVMSTIARTQHIIDPLDEQLE